MEHLTLAALQNHQYNRRLQECSFLLKKKYNFKKILPLQDFWSNKEKYYLNWNEIPQIRSCLEYDLERACLLCGLKSNLNNYLLIFTFAHYGVWRTTRWLIRQQDARSGSQDLNLTAAYATINYLYSLNLSSPTPQRIDPLVDIYIEEVVFKWRKENKLGISPPLQPLNPVQQKAFIFDVNHTYPLEVANIVEAAKENIYLKHKIKERRNRETKRNYFYWRGNKRGLTLFEVGVKWETLFNHTDIGCEFDRAAMDDKVNGGIQSYLSSNGPLLTSRSILSWYKHFLRYYNEKEAAEQVFEMAAKDIQDILEAEMVARLTPGDNKH